MQYWLSGQDENQTENRSKVYVDQYGYKAVGVLVVLVYWHAYRQQHRNGSIIGGILFVSILVDRGHLATLPLTRYCASHQGIIKYGGQREGKLGGCRF